ncbi:uncharacterized protein LOC110263641 [Arachis ipaensis]|uniref:uncharacterized protein LOC110263641 n=1 Tax=Arachis ipaensis TaxID=130454 RepID=UPI000A2B7C50|nr:uncharacterized protein LOC110263641 [Arachis ipaensis]
MEILMEIRVLIMMRNQEREKRLCFLFTKFFYHMERKEIPYGQIMKIKICFLQKLFRVAAIWNLLGESVKKENCTNTNKQSAEFLIRPNTSKKVVQKIKRLLCARERDISIVAIPTKQEKVKQCYKGPICEGKKECGRQGANLKTMDYLSSIDEWRNMEEQVKAISVEITDHILEGINNEIVLEFIATWADQS